MERVSFFVSSRWGAVTLVGISLVATLLLWELLTGILADDVSMNWIGITVLTLWGAVVVVGIVAITRARDADRSFRGVGSELLRMTASALLLLVLSIVVMITLTRPFEWESLNSQGRCVQQGDVTRCVSR